MAKSWPGRPVDEEFLRQGLDLVRYSAPVAASADEVWAELAARDRDQYLPGVRGRWITPEPTGVGSTRVVTLAGLVEFEEQYFAWDPQARRWALSVVRFGLPGITALAEEVQAIPAGTGAIVTWRMVVPRTRLSRALSWLAAPIVKVLARRTFARSFGAPVA